MAPELLAMEDWHIASASASASVEPHGDNE